MGAANVASGPRPPGRSSSFPRPCAFPFFARGVETGPWTTVPRKGSR